MANYESNFTDKDARITLVEGDKVLTEEKDVIIFKDHFEKIAETLKLHRLIFSDLSDDPALNAIENFYHLASVLKIKEARDSSDCLSLNPLNANPQNGQRHSNNSAICWRIVWVCLTSLWNWHLKG